MEYFRLVYSLSCVFEIFLKFSIVIYFKNLYSSLKISILNG